MFLFAPYAVFNIWLYVVKCRQETKYSFFRYYRRREKIFSSHVLSVAQKALLASQKLSICLLAALVILGDDFEAAGAPEGVTWKAVHWSLTDSTHCQNLSPNNILKTLYPRNTLEVTKSSKFRGNYPKLWTLLSCGTSTFQFDDVKISFMFFKNHYKKSSSFYFWLNHLWNHGNHLLEPPLHSMTLEEVWRFSP